MHSKKNAFTRASQARSGLLESADGGTLFLDKVGGLSPPVQVNLLRMLKDHQVLRIGCRTPCRLARSQPVDTQSALLSITTQWTDSQSITEGTI